MLLTAGFLARYGRVLAIAAAVALFVLAGAAKFNSAIDRAERRGYQHAQDQAKAAIAKLDADTAAREAEDREIARAHDIHFQEVQRDLQNRVDALTAARRIDLGRLQGCADHRSAETAAAPTTTTEPDGGARERGHALQAERDLGHDLVRYAGECERYREQLSSLQSWVEATSIGDHHAK